MANSIVRLPTGYFPDPGTSRPLFFAKIYIGEPDLDPKIPANQKTVTGRREDGVEVTLAQPIRTNRGGVPVDGTDGTGNVVTLLVDGAYSMTVDDRKDAQKYNFANVLDGAPVTFNDKPVLYRDTIAEAVADQGLTIGQYIKTKGYHSPNDGGGANYIVVAGGTGTDDGGSYHDMANGNQLKMIINGRVNILSYGVRRDGLTDISTGFTNAVRLGKPLYVPNGSYFISEKGANTDGVLLDNLTVDLDVFCDDDATFVSDAIDGDMIRISVPSDGSGLPNQMLKWKWEGGVFDQRNQKNSTVVPFSGEFPPKNVGTSATADALHIIGFYSSPAETAAVEEVSIIGVTFKAVDDGGHWEDGGGDSGLFVVGVKSITVKNCKGFGNRDATIYPSGSNSSGLLSESLLVDNLQTFSSCYGCSPKRSIKNTTIANSYFENSVYGISLELLVGDGVNNGVVSNNKFKKNFAAVRTSDIDSYVFCGNLISEIGTTMSDGTASTFFNSGTGLALNGVTNSTIVGNICSGINPLYNTVPSFGDFILLKPFNSTDSVGNLISSNLAIGINDLGNDNGGIGVSENVYQWNRGVDCAIDRFVITDTDSTIISVDSEGEIFSAGIGGNRFRMRINQAGDLNIEGSFLNNNEAVVRTRKTGWGIPTGTATRTTFDTTTVTTQELAERVKALLDDLNFSSGGHGLIGT